MLHIVTSYMKQNKSRKQTLESAQYGLEISFKARAYRGLVPALFMGLLACSATILVNTVFIFRLRKNESLCLTSWARWRATWSLFLQN